MTVKGNPEPSTVLAIFDQKRLRRLVDPRLLNVAFRTDLDQAIRVLATELALAESETTRRSRLREVLAFTLKNQSRKTQEKLLDILSKRLFADVRKLTQFAEEEGFLS